MSLRFALALVAGVAVPLTLLAPQGCSTVTVAEQQVKGDDGGGGYLFLDAGEDAGDDADAAKDALPDYVDPGCPDAGPPISDFQCDAYDQGNGDCGPGDGCYIYVNYPDPGQPCGQETYGTYCAPAGSGGQGAPCNGGLDCAAGHVCVITGSGTQCVQLCPLAGADNCPSGYVCEVIDVEGFGGCL